MLDNFKEATVRVLICTGAFALAAPLYKSHIHHVQLTNDIIGRFAADGALWGLTLSAFIALMTLWRNKSPIPFAALFTMIGGCFALIGLNTAELDLSVHLLVSTAVFTFHWLVAHFACHLASVREETQPQ